MLLFVRQNLRWPMHFFVQAGHTILSMFSLQVFLRFHFFSYAVLGPRRNDIVLQSEYRVILIRSDKTIDQQVHVEALAQIDILYTCTTIQVPNVLHGCNESNHFTTFDF